MLNLNETLTNRLGVDGIVTWIICALAFPSGTLYYTSSPSDMTLIIGDSRVRVFKEGLVAFVPPRALSTRDRQVTTLSIADPDILPLIRSNPNGVSVTSTIFLLDPNNIQPVININEGIDVYSGKTDGYSISSDSNTYEIQVVSTNKLDQVRPRTTTNSKQLLADPRDSAFFQVDKPPESLILTWGR